MRRCAGGGVSKRPYGSDFLQLRGTSALHEEGTSHDRLFDDVREQQAKALLREGRKITDVATRLGFRNESAFHRAFKRWTMLTPHQWLNTVVG